jgi:hypothetical protein
MITIRFNPDPNFDACTPYQAETYRVLREGLSQGKRLKVREVLEALGLKTVPPFESRLNHLQEKGLISWKITEPSLAVPA